MDAHDAGQLMIPADDAANGAAAHGATTNDHDLHLWMSDAAGAHVGSYEDNLLMPMPNAVQQHQNQHQLYHEQQAQSLRAQSQQHLAHMHVYQQQQAQQQLQLAEAAAAAEAARLAASNTSTKRQPRGSKASSSSTMAKAGSARARGGRGGHGMQTGSSKPQSSLEAAASAAAAAAVAAAAAMGSAAPQAPMVVKPTTAGKGASTGAAKRRLAPSGLSHGSGDDTGGEDMSSLNPDQKRRRRLEKNREIARNCRRRKREKYQKLEDENERLRQWVKQLEVQVNQGQDGSEREQSRKAEIARLRGRLDAHAGEADLRAQLGRYKELYSDFGRERTAAIQFHMAKLKALLVPTTVSKMTMWALQQEDEFYDERKNQKTFGGGIWNMLCTELELTDEQKRSLMGMRAGVRQQRRSVADSLQVLQELDARVRGNFESMARTMDAVMEAITPAQQVRFLLWIERNQACAFMLNNLWNQQAGADGDEGTGTSSSSSLSNSSAAGLAAAAALTQQKQQLQQHMAQRSMPVPPVSRTAAPRPTQSAKPAQSAHAPVLAAAMHHHNQQEHQQLHHHQQQQKHPHPHHHQAQQQLKQHPQHVSSSGHGSGDEDFADSASAMNLSDGTSDMRASAGKGAFEDDADADEELLLRMSSATVPVTPAGGAQAFAAAGKQAPVVLQHHVSQGHQQHVVHQQQSQQQQQQQPQHNADHQV